MTTTSSPETGPAATGSVTFVDGVGPGLRASDADRHATVARLQEAVALGLLTHEDGSDRMALAYDARYLSDLPPLTADLPRPPSASPKVPAAAPGWRRLLAELHTLADDRGLEVVDLPGHRRAPGSWLGDGVGPASDLTALTYWVPDIAERDVYVCGPEPWADDVRTTCQAAGLPADRFHVESFGW